MQIDFEIFNGISVGFELVPADDEYLNTLVIDVVFIRILIQW